jgi:hypothetical protein
MPSFKIAPIRLGSLFPGSSQSLKLRFKDQWHSVVSVLYRVTGIRSDDRALFVKGSLGGTVFAGPDFV